MAVGADHFNRKTVRALEKKGVTIYGLQAVPDKNGSFLNSRTGYLVNDNGTGRCLTYFEVLNIAKD